MDVSGLMTRISSSSTRISAKALAELLGPTSTPKRSSSNVLLDPPSQSTVVNKIEKHIEDVKRGYGDISKDVANLLGQQDANASALLSQTNPKALKLYSGYLSGLRYDRAARFVNGVEYGLSQSAKLSEPVATEPLGPKPKVDVEV